jgi:hypothetical protein
MTFKRFPSFLLSLQAVAALAVTACAHQVTVERQSNGVIHLTCDASLQECLNEAEMLCEHDRFTVLRGYDQHDWKGGRQQAGSYGPHIEIRKSEAYVRCGYHGSWGPDVNAMKAMDICPVPEVEKPAPRPVPAPPPPPVPAAPDAGVPPAP